MDEAAESHLRGWVLNNQPCCAIIAVNGLLFVRISLKILALE